MAHSNYIPTQTVSILALLALVPFSAIAEEHKPASSLAEAFRPQFWVAPAPMRSIPKRLYAPSGMKPRITPSSRATMIRLAVVPTDTNAASSGVAKEGSAPNGEQDDLLIGNPYHQEGNFKDERGDASASKSPLFKPLQNIQPEAGIFPAR